MLVVTTYCATEKRQSVNCNPHGAPKIHVLGDTNVLSKSWTWLKHNHFTFRWTLTLSTNRVSDHCPRSIKFLSTTMAGLFCAWFPALFCAPRGHEVLPVRAGRLLIVENRDSPNRNERNLKRWTRKCYCVRKPIKTPIPYHQLLPVVLESRTYVCSFSGLHACEYLREYSVLFHACMHSRS